MGARDDEPVGQAQATEPASRWVSLPAPDGRRWPPILVEAGLVELAVLEASRRLDPDRRALYHRDRERAYRIDAEEMRDEQFAEIHRDWFLGLGLAAPLVGPLLDQACLPGRVTRVEVVRASSRDAESAELRDIAEPGATGVGRTIVVRLAPESFQDAPALSAFLRRALQRALGECNRPERAHHGGSRSHDGA